MSDAYNYPPQTIQFPEQDDEEEQPLYIDMPGGTEEPPEIDAEGTETHPDGSMVFNFGQEEQGKQPEKFDDNLAEFIPEAELNKIASDLLRGIEDDIQSSAEWRQNLAQGIKLLGTIIEPSATDAGTTSTVFEGQHKTTHPLLLEACLTFQANARASLLPAAGPVKIRDDEPQKASVEQEAPQMPPGMGHNGGPQLDDNKQQGQQGQQQAPQVNVNLQQPGQGPQPQHADGGSIQDYRRFHQWKQQYAPNDSGQDYDYYAAYRAGLTPDQSGHWPDTYKRPNHPTFSDESIYARDSDAGYAAGRWDGDQFNPSPVRTPYANGGAVGYADGGGPPTPFGSPMGNGMNGVGQFAPPQQPQGQIPPGAMPGMMGQPPQQQEPKTSRDLLAEAMETDFNKYFTVIDKNYYPDTDKMLFNVGLSGQGIKKVYHNPLRRMPISESVPVEDFIVSNAFSDLCNMPRITQRITMRPSVLKRMQLVGAYRDVELADPTESSEANEVKEMQADTMGVTITVNDPEDIDFELYECYCELELDEFAPEQFKGVGLPLPYKVVIAKESEKILEIRRNWKEDDQECRAKEFFVDFSYVKAFGFYGMGLMHILGNTTRTLTAAWREFIDSGMFASFPGFVFAKGAGRQLTNNFRVPPGGGVGLDVGLMDIRQAVMPLPYKDLQQGHVAFIQHVEEYGQRLGGTANINVGEGRQDAPVGTTLAMIEQATKPLGAVLKRLHTAASRELQLFKERLKEDPGAFWRFNRKPAIQWREEQFLEALEDFDLIPVSDPNNPTHMHRMAKASMMFQIASAAPQLFDQRKVWNRLAAYADIEDAEGLLADQQQGTQPDPFAMAALKDSQTKEMGLQIKAQEVAQRGQGDVQKLQMELADRQAERESRERIENLKLEGDKMKLASTLAIHSSTQEMSAADQALKLQMDQNKLHITADQRSYDRAHQMNQQSADLAAQTQMHQQKLASDETLGHHKVVADVIAKTHAANTQARTAHHRTMTDAQVKRDVAAKQASARKSVST